MTDPTALNPNPSNPPLPLVPDQDSQRLQTLYIINDMLRQVEAKGLEINLILPQVLEIAVQQLRVRTGSIIIVNEQGHAEYFWHKDEDNGQKPIIFLEDVLTQGLAGWVIQNRQVAIIHDTTQDKRWLPRPNHITSEQPWSALCVPLLARHHAIGAITLTKPEPHQFTTADISLCMAIANQAATTIQNARLYERTKRQLQESAFLNQAGTVINSSLDIQEIMQLLLTKSNQLLNVEALSIALVDEQTKELVYQVAVGIGSEAIVGLRLPASSGVSGWVMQHGQPALVPDTSKDSRISQSGDQRTGYKTKAIICAPLQAHGKVLGTIQAINPHKGIFTQDDLELLVKLANLASSAINNATQFALTQAAEARYLGLFEDNIDPILLTNLQGKIIEVNRRAEQFFGYQRHQLLGMAIQQLHPTETEFNSDNILLTIDSEIQVHTTQAITYNNHLIPVEIYIKQLQTEDGKTIQWIHRDISKQVELAKIREELSAMLLHDLQSPLSNIISGLELITYELNPESDPMAIKILEIAKHSSQRLLHLTKSLLNIYQLESGYQITNQTFVQPSKMLAEAKAVLQPSLEKRKITLQGQLDPRLPEVFVDKDMITRVLINLLDNALKFSQDRQTLTVAIFPNPKDSRWILVSVMDQGPGIASAYRQLIFDKFYRVPGKSGSKGIGLGLAFCRLAVEAHGGQIWVDDAPSGGARFNFTLPTGILN